MNRIYEKDRADIFDKVIDRRGTNSLKHDGMAERGMPADVLPFWVADMDFEAPPEAVLAATRAAAHGVYGYSVAGKGYYDAAINWQKVRFGWDVDRDWIITTPGVVFMVASAVRALSEPGDTIMIQNPVYAVFAPVLRANDRKVVSSDLRLVGGRYEIDFDDFEKVMVESGAKIFLLCHPHNPIGRVWTREELKRMGEICVEHGVMVISDEIHEDFVYAGKQHIPFAAVDPLFPPITVTCTAPSKTFNLAGLQASNAFVANPELRRRINRALDACDIGLNPIAIAAAEAAYRYGAPWLEALKEYLMGNYALLRGALEKGLPAVRPMELEATYLAWLDCSCLGMAHIDMVGAFAHKAKVWLNDGATFGANGVGFMRMNLACPRSTLNEGIQRIVEAFS
ncbi:MAG: pyridoxal phosphate-dependent aminotransferase [Oscillospiraceae bacterium]|jgi:cystathionine beta-lyase|nr:pyridoxal phosphate-dependent aminotransferase [Oscillospiraceae bacterium]